MKRIGLIVLAVVVAVGFGEGCGKEEGIRMDGIGHLKGDAVKEALLVMLTKSTNPFLILEETKTKKFIQFLNQDGEILIDFPTEPLEEPEIEKAEEYFQKNEIPFNDREDDGGSWQRTYPRGDVDKVVNLATGALCYIFGFPEDFEFLLISGWGSSEDESK